MALGARHLVGLLGVERLGELLNVAVRRRRRALGRVSLLVPLRELGKRRPVRIRECIPILDETLHGFVPDGVRAARNHELYGTRWLLGRHRLGLHLRERLSRRTEGEGVDSVAHERLNGLDDEKLLVLCVHCVHEALLPCEGTG